MLGGTTNYDQLSNDYGRHRRINPGIPMTEARGDFARFRELISQRTAETKTEG